MGTTILEIPISDLSKNEVLEKIKKYLVKPTGFFHIVSLNPENMVLTQHNQEFSYVVRESQIKIIDGVGVVVAGRILGVPLGGRVSGVDLMEDLLSMANDRRLRVMLMGGQPKIAEKIANCQGRVFSEVKFTAIQGISDIKHPTIQEEQRIFSIVARYKPQFLFVSFGSPFQELWLYHHRKKLEGLVVMGVGGAFDYLSGNIIRAPRLVRQIGLEWLFRLLRQPWRLKRQMRLFEFLLRIFKERLAR